MIFLPKSGIRRIPQRLRRSHRRRLSAADLARIGPLNAALAELEAWIEREASAQRAAFRHQRCQVLPLSPFKGERGNT